MLFSYSKTCQLDTLYSLSYAGLLKFCDERGISIVLGGPFNSGILATGAVEGAKYYYADPSEVYYIILLWTRCACDWDHTQLDVVCMP